MRIVTEYCLQNKQNMLALEFMVHSRWIKREWFKLIDCFISLPSLLEVNLISEENIFQTGNFFYQKCHKEIFFITTLFFYCYYFYKMQYSLKGPILWIQCFQCLSIITLYSWPNNGMLYNTVLFFPSFYGTRNYLAWYCLIHISLRK